MRARASLRRIFCGFRSSPHTLHALFIRGPRRKVTHNSSRPNDHAFCVYSVSLGLVPLFAVFEVREDIRGYFYDVSRALFNTSARYSALEIEDIGIGNDVLRIVFFVLMRKRAINKLTQKSRYGTQWHDEKTDEEIGHGQRQQEVVRHVVELPV